MDHDKVVSQNRAALRATIDFAEKQLGALAWEPAAGSEGAAELSNAVTRYDRSPWGESPPRTAYAAAKLMMLGVVDDLKSLERLLVDPVPVIGPTVIARSAIEIASGAWWLMEPGIGARRRVCRELVASLTSARRAKQVADEYVESFGASGDPIPADIAAMIAEARQQEPTVMQRIRELAVTAPTSGLKIENEEADSATVATAKMLKALLPTNWPATTVYRTYSAVTHGQPAARQRYPQVRRILRRLAYRAGDLELRHQLLVPTILLDGAGPGLLGGLLPRVGRASTCH
jgi:hypothetical protein